MKTIIWVDKGNKNYFKMNEKPDLKEDVENFDCIEVNEEAFNKYEELKSQGHIVIYVDGKFKIKIEDFNRDKRIEELRKELSSLKVEFSEKEFLFTGKYLQKNRERGDRDSLTGLVVLLMATNQNTYDGWKVIDKETGEHVYLKLTLDDFKLMALHMQEQVTKAMKVESELIVKLNILSDNELKAFDSRKEYESLWS